MPVSVAELCRRHQLTVRELAEKAELDEMRVTAIVAGRWTPSPEDRRKIAGVFEVAVEEIRWGHVTPIQHIWGH